MLIINSLRKDYGKVRGKRYGVQYRAIVPRRSYLVLGFLPTALPAESADGGEGGPTFPVAAPAGSCIRARAFLAIPEVVFPGTGR